MQIILPRIKRVQAATVASEIEGNPRAAARFLCFEMPEGCQPGILALCKAAKEKHGDFLHMILGTPKRARTARQGRAVFGWCADIAEQLVAGGQYPDASMDEVKDRVYQAMKRMAVGDGYPQRTSPIDGCQEPESQALVSTEQDCILQKTIQKFADENGFYLTEIVEDKAVRCFGGKALRDIDPSDTVKGKGDK